jgi:hypothetical protein
MDNWTVVDQGTVDAPSDWVKISEELCQQSNIHGTTAASEDGREGTYIYWNQSDALSWTDYIIDVSFLSNDDDGLGVMFRYQDENNYYKLDCDEQRMFTKLFKVKDGVETVIGSDDLYYTAGIQNSLQIKIQGNEISASLNGTPLFGGPVTDNDLVMGGVALYTWGNNAVCFDDLSVAAITDVVSVYNLASERSDGLGILRQTANSITVRVPCGFKGNSAQADLFDVSGKRIYRYSVPVAAPGGVIKFKWKENNGSRSAFQPGIYFIRINFGRRQITEKIYIFYLSAF